MVLIIDNYDSFVFNLARYVIELGHEVNVVRNDKITLSEIAQLQPTHIILSPGPCTPYEAGICLNLIEEFKEKVPILGVCLGHQAIAVACGGKVVRAAYPQHGKPDAVWHEQEGLFHGLPNPLTVGRYHSLIVQESALPTCLQVTAKTKRQEVMAIAHRKWPVVGVQFHPESILTEHGHALLATFLDW